MRGSRKVVGITPRKLGITPFQFKAAVRLFLGGSKGDWKFNLGLGEPGECPGRQAAAAAADKAFSVRLIVGLIQM